MKPPDVIEVMGQRYVVEAVADPSYSIHRDASSGSQVGMADIMRGLIRYRPQGVDSSKDNERDTILHELVHLVMYMTGLDHMLDGEHDADHTEKFVGPLATALLATLRANPELVAYLLSE